MIEKWQKNDRDKGQDQNKKTTKKWHKNDRKMTGTNDRTKKTTEANDKNMTMQTTK